MKNIDTTYSFNYLDEMYERDNVYQFIKTLFDMHGCFEIISENHKVKVYNIDLSILFQYNDVKVLNRDTDKPEIINGNDYFNSYLEGYKEGEQSIKPNEDIIYGSNADSYISDLQNKYYNIPIGYFRGWEYVKRVKQISFTHKEIRDFGYYSGIVSVVDKMQIDYKKQFQKFTHFERDIKLRLNDFNFFKTAITLRYNGLRFLLEDKEGKKREFTPYDFLDYTLENYCEKCDITEGLREKILILKQAYSKIFDTINHYNILGCEKILEMCNNKIDLIESELKLSEPQQSAKEPEKIEFNTRIFTSLKGFMLFDKLVKKCPKVSDTYSFIYLQLVKDGYIFKDITHKEIKDFFNSEPYKITIDKIKTLNVLENEQRMALYSSVLDSNK